MNIRESRRFFCMREYFVHHIQAALFVLVLATLTLISSTTQATVIYKEIVLADAPRYYWNWDDGDFAPTAMISTNLGAGVDGLITASKTYAPAPSSGTNNAGGHSLIRRMCP